MEHNYIDLASESKIKELVIYCKENNLDGNDNLGELPEQPAVFAICGRVNGRAANPRFVDVTKDLQETIRNHFDQNVPAVEETECFKEFMTSIKIKVLIYMLLPAGTKVERMEIKEEWKTKFDPKCNRELNKIH